MPVKPQRFDSCSVVLVGNFNPAIFQPQWFSSRNLLRQEESDKANIAIISSQVAQFSADWVRFVVTDERFMAETTDPGQSPALRDLVAGTFSLLEHTPAKQMGLNRYFHFEMDDVDSWHKVGDILAPKAPWDAVLDGRPGLVSLVIQGKRETATSEYLRVRIEPSTKVQHGVFIEVNEHFEAPKNEPVRWLVDQLIGQWEPSMKNSEDVAKNLLSAVLK